MADLLYSGGPCSGRHVHVDDDSLVDGRIVCGGMNYRAYPVAQGEWLALPPSHAPPPTIVASAPQAAHAWRHLIHTIIKTVPDDIRRSQRARQRMLRIGRR